MKFGKSVLAGIGLVAAAGIGLAGTAQAGTNTGGSGNVNGSQPTRYNPAAQATWSETLVQNNGWYKIANARIDMTGIYSWRQTFSLTEKQKQAGGPVTVTGTVSLWTEYGSYTGDLPPLTVASVDIPFGNQDVGGGVYTEHNSPVGAALLNAEINIVSNIKPYGVSVDSWFGY